MNEDYKIWLVRAKSSLALSKAKIDEEIFYEDLCFQAQQAVEKSLKAFLVFLDIDPEKTHNLVNLIKELAKRIDIPNEINEVVILNDYAIQTRYPGYYAPIEEDEYKKAIEKAEYCVKWIDGKIKQIIKEVEDEKNQSLLDNFNLSKK
ncbi:MAG: HEPN domain-containing protein [Treponema sp.]|jgi:HEPN domain-containing protein|nr:HEPN domain-containing protein [Treponema sp.]